uniref:HTH_Tnp_Tc3_2 domain-containing protein n=1 Tax=Heterorhabditis bacteriophora TaxID=37862 RepID=A0A1I7WLF9_HETBA
MSRASTLSLYERGQIKVPSTTAYTVKRSADVVKRSRKPIMNFLCHQEEYGTKKSSGRPSKLNDCEKKEILRTASNNTISINEIRRICCNDASKTTMWRMLDKFCWTNEHNVLMVRDICAYIPINTVAYRRAVGDVGLKRGIIVHRRRSKKEQYYSPCC